MGDCANKEVICWFGNVSGHFVHRVPLTVRYDFGGSLAVLHVARLRILTTRLKPVGSRQSQIIRVLKFQSLLPQAFCGMRQLRGVTDKFHEQDEFLLESLMDSERLQVPG
jgi:hypothetical protein